MITEIEKAIKFLAAQIKDGVTADDALKCAQAALNLANCESVIQHTDSSK